MSNNIISNAMKMLIMAPSAIAVDNENDEPISVAQEVAKHAIKITKENGKEAGSQYTASCSDMGFWNTVRGVVNLVTEDAPVKAADYYLAIRGHALFMQKCVSPDVIKKGGYMSNGIINKDLALFGWGPVVSNVAYEVTRSSFSHNVGTMAEELNIFSPDDIDDSIYSSVRELSGEGEPLAKARIDTWIKVPNIFGGYENRLYLVYPGETPGKKEFYENLHNVEAVFHAAAQGLAGYYANALDGFVENDDVIAAKYTDINSSGEYEETYEIYFADKETQEICAKHYAWEDAQRCEQYIKAGGNVDYMAGCWWMYDNGHFKDERNEMIGKEEPQKCPTNIDEMSVVDIGMDGMVDSVVADWANMRGRFNIEMRSDYTAPALDRFNSVFAKAPEPSRYSYTVSSSVSAKILVKNGDNVCAGEKLFTYKGDDEKIYGVYATAHGKITDLDYARWPGFYFNLEPTTSIGCWYSGAYLFVN